MDPELQFDQAQRPAQATTCSACGSPLAEAYYQAAGRIFCARCAEGLKAALFGKEGEAGRLAKSVAWGFGGGIAGGAVYTAVLALAHINAALITILIGWLVGKAMRKGSGGRGGRTYQFLAVAITYVCIGFFATLADVLSGDRGTVSLLQAAITCIVGAFIGPVLMSLQGIFGAIITFFGLLQAWQMCGAPKLDITGPHAIAPAANPLPGGLPPVPPSA